MKETAQFLVELATNANLKAAYEKNPEAVLAKYEMDHVERGESHKLLLITPENSDHKLVLITPGS